MAKTYVFLPICHLRSSEIHKLAVGGSKEFDRHVLSIVRKWLWILHTVQITFPWKFIQWCL